MSQQRLEYLLTMLLGTILRGRTVMDTARQGSPIPTHPRIWRVKGLILFLEPQL